MTSIFSFTLFAGYAAVILSLAGFAVLLRSMLTQATHMREQKSVFTQLHAHITQCAKEQIASHDQIISLKEQCASLHARQQMVEKHGSDTQRIDLAMRMLKRGTGDTATLHDLGLSASEIKLLLRLHSTPAQRHRPVENIAEAVKRKAVRAVVPVSAAISTQGQALAQLFEN